MRRSSYGHYDYIIALSVLFLVIVGFTTLSSVSPIIGVRQFNDSYYYIRHQLLSGLLPGLVGFFFGLFFYYKNYQKIAPFFLLLSITLLFIVSFTSLGSNVGSLARRWIVLGNASFQPSEIIKLSFIIYIAAWLLKKPNFWAFVSVNGLVVLLLLLQPAVSTALILMGTVSVMYLASGAPWRRLLFLFFLGAVLVGIFVLVTGGYQIERVKSFFRPSEAQNQTSGFQARQALIAIGSGRLWGVGYGQSTIKARGLPETIGDSIFAVFAEEWGFAGAALLVFAFSLLVVRGLFLAQRIHDQFGKLLVVGIVSLVGLQSFVNMAAISGLIPLTGVPLPFISYGGTAFAVFITSIGIVLNVSKYGR